MTVSAVGAALLALAASAFVRTNFSEVMSALTPRTSNEAPSDRPIQDDSKAPPVVGFASDEGHPKHLTRPASPHKSSRDTFSQQMDRGIRKLAERRYEIKRSTLELALGNLGMLASSVRVTPEVRDGKPVGFRLFAIRADGPFAKLGLQNDDVLVSINGLDLATPERVLDAFGKLRTASHLVLGLVRENHEVTLNYTIR